MTDQERLSEILETMDVPKLRRDVTEAANKRWLLRNLKARNGQHPDIGEAMSLLKPKR